MKKNNSKSLPKFTVTTLGLDDLRQVTGGTSAGSGTAATRSFCHVDGLDDDDKAK